MKKWQKRLAEIARSLNLFAKMKDASLTADEQKQLFAEYEKVHKVTFAADKAANEDHVEETPGDTLLSAEEQKAISALLTEDPAGNGDGNEGGDQTIKVTTVKEAVSELSKKVTEQNSTIKILIQEPEAKKPVATVLAGADSAKVMSIVLGRTPHTAKHLFGIENELYALGKFHNDIFVTRKEVDVKSISRDEKKTFEADFNKFNDALKNRITELSSMNALDSMDFKKMAEGASHIDYSEIMDKAGEYVIRRTDMIIAYMRSLPSVASFFPTVSNVQNKEVAPGANFGELSQGYRSGRIFKGMVAFTAEIYSVVDLMFKYKFSDLIKLEKQYIGYLNREGSNVMKWTFIEWIITHFGQILTSEQQRRKVMGVRVPQQAVTSNPALLGADGAIRAIERVEEDLKVLPFEDLKLYTNSTIVEYFEAFYDAVEAIIPTMEGMKMNANLKHKKWYTRGFREKYGTDNDFTGVKAGLIDISPDVINWVPNMPMNCYKAWITVPGNVECYEDKPNEMLLMYFEQDFEDTLVRSRWKEGAGLKQAGIQYKTAADLVASGRANQWIFTNFPVTELDADTTTVDGSVNNVFLTKVNTQATVLTDITNASIERVYKIIFGSLTFGTTIAKTGNFSKIASAFTPKAVGDWIKLYAELEDYTDTIDGETVTLTRPTGKFLELARSGGDGEAYPG